MNKRKADGMSFIILGILFVIYNLFVFLLCDANTVVFWISYIFMLAAFAFQVAAQQLSFKSLDVETVFFGIPLMELSIYYFFAELFASAVFMFFQDLVGFKIPLLIQALLLAVFVIVAILAIAGRDAVKESKDSIQEQVSALKSMGVDVEMLAETTQDPELRSKLGKLAEAIRYSDPMSTPAIDNIEQQIHMGICELRLYCEQGSKEQALQTISSLNLLVLERNKKLILSK